jgi:hypothetical protein
MLVPNNILYDKEGKDIIIIQKNVKERGDYLEGIKYLTLLSLVPITITLVTEKYIFLLLLIPLIMFGVNDILKKRTIKLIIRNNELIKEVENKITSVSIGVKSEDREPKVTKTTLGKISEIQSLNLTELKDKFYLNLINKNKNKELITFSFDRESIDFIKEIIESYIS